MAFEELISKPKNGWTRIDDATKTAIHEYCKKYSIFLDKSKTEREAVREGISAAIQQGFVDISSIQTWQPGTKVYFNYRNKALILAIFGTKSPLDGLNIVAAHVDAPRLDLKPRPIREDEEFGILETHYYGGIKKYQWLSTPLALHGVIITKEGKQIDIAIGDNPSDPVFVIPDILPHLAKKIQMTKNISEAVAGEDLDVVVASMPLPDEEKNAVKKQFLKIFNERYGITEEDFVSAEIEVVPANCAKDVGIDHSMLGAYGQDDRVCGFAALQALIDLNGIPDQTAISVLADKEEIGSAGNTGMQAAYIDYFIEVLISLAKPNFTALDVRKTWYNSKVLSADVTAGVDTIWKSVHEMTNAAHLGYGAAIAKYTGSGGKSGSNDANAEFMAKVRNVLDKEQLIWQTAELGKVDEGGGGTVALYLANRGAEVVDIGTPLLGMHSLFEIASKLDIYYTYRAILAFFKYMN